MQQPGGLIVDDRGGVVFKTGPSKRPYLAAVLPAAALAIVVGIGLLGPKSLSGARPLAGGATGTADSSVAARTVLASAAVRPTIAPSLRTPAEPVATPQPTEVVPNVGLARMQMSAASIHAARVDAYGNPSVAFFGHQVYVGSGGEVTRTDLDGSGESQLIASMDAGYTVDSLATTGEKVIVLALRRPDWAGGTCVAVSCPTTSTLDWDLLLLAPDGSDGRVVEEFVTSDGADPTDTPRLAATDGLWTLSRPDLRAGHAGQTAIEVHSDSGRLLWSTVTSAEVMSLALGGSRLAAALLEPGEGGARSVALADSSDPRPVTVANAAWDISISSDGQNVAWDGAGCVSTLEGPLLRQACPQPFQKGSFPVFSSPRVDTWRGSPITIWAIDALSGRWLGISYPLLGRDVWLADAWPEWYGVRGSVVVWASFTKSGVEIHEVDLSTAGYQIE